MILLLRGSGLSAQTDAAQSIVQAYSLEEHGRVDEAIAMVRPLVDSGALHGYELGRAWTVLGLAYTGQGDFRAAQHAYEAAITILEPLPEHVVDYAVALDNFGLLYRSMGQLEAATDMRLKTLHIYERTGDHAGIARACNNLAGLAVEQKEMKRAGRYLNRAMEEMKAAATLDDDDAGAIYSMQGEFASVKGDKQAAVDGYEHAMQIWRRAHTEDHPNTGWGYLLLGQAHADVGRTDEATKEMQEGLSILARTIGRTSAHYLEAEIAYSRLLDKTGAHEAAARLRAADETTLKALGQRQCAGCTISVEALR
ncbi:MAG: tetratricopeptide repeat protein [Edaphobacter sp.]